jgi:HEAT repeat protein
MIGLLALGFLQDRSSVPTLKQRLESGNSHSMIYAARALMEIDQGEHGAAVAHALLTCEGLDFALISVLLKPFRMQLDAALMPACPQPQPQAAIGQAPHAQSFQWLRLALALKLLVPQWRLTPFLSSEQHIEILIAALRLVQCEQDTEAVTCHVQHPDWRVRVQVARALGRTGDLMHRPILLGLLTDGQWWVRYRSAQALLQIPGMRYDQLHEKVVATQDRYALSMLIAVHSEK